MKAFFLALAILSSIPVMTSAQTACNPAVSQCR